MEREGQVPTVPKQGGTRNGYWAVVWSTESRSIMLRRKAQLEDSIDKGEKKKHKNYPLNWEYLQFTYFFS